MPTILRPGSDSCPVFWPSSAARELRSLTLERACCQIWPFLPPPVDRLIGAMRQSPDRQSFRTRILVSPSSANRQWPVASPPPNRSLPIDSTGRQACDVSRGSTPASHAYIPHQKPCQQP